MKKKIIFFLLLILQISANKKCSKTSDCHAYENCINNECIHKSLFPLEFAEFIGIFAISITISLANAGGIGGGGLLMPIFMIFFGFTAQQSVPISNFNILIASIVRFVINFKQKHPYKDKLAIDYEIIIAFMPMILFGSSIGVILNGLFPEVITIICLTLTLIFMAYKTTTKAIELRKKEKKLKENNSLTEKLNENSVTSEKSEASLLNKQNNENNFNFYSSEKEKNGINNPSNLSEREKIALVKISQRENSHFDPVKISLICVNFIILVLEEILRGNQSMASIVTSIKMCSLAYWIILIIFGIFSIIFATIVLVFLVKNHAKKQNVGYDFHESDFQLNLKNCLMLDIVALFGGIAAGFLGIGGGMIYNPLLLGLGQLPTVASATGMYLVMCTSFATTLQFSLAKTLNIEYAGFLAIFVALCTCYSIIKINKIIKKSKKESIIVIILSVLIIIAVIVMPLIGVLNLIEDNKQGIKLFEMKDFCKQSI